MAAPQRHIVTDVESYPSKLKELLAAPGPQYIVFTADPDPATGQPWCPDCVRTVPTVRSVVASRNGSLLEVQVGPRPVWKSAAHPFRADPTLKLTGIPTLLKLGADGREAGRLGPELEACDTAQQAEELLRPFVAT